MKKNWFLELIKALLAAFTGGTTTVPIPEPPPEEVDEFVYTRGVSVEIPIDITRGTFECEVYVPERGRIDDWKTAEILGIYDSPRGFSGNLYALLPYKIKGCVGKKCHETRYAVKWDQWHKVRLEWTPQYFKAIVGDQEKVESVYEPWGKNTRLIYGCYGDERHPNGHLLEDAKMRNIKVNGVAR